MFGFDLMTNFCIQYPSATVSKRGKFTMSISVRTRMTQPRKSQPQSRQMLLISATMQASGGRVLARGTMSCAESCSSGYVAHMHDSYGGTA